MGKWILIVAVLCLFFSCGRESGLEQRADRPMAAALERAIGDRYGKVEQMKVRDLKTVYTDDSVCIRQFFVDVVDRGGKREMLEYRYVFLLDMFMSRVEGRPVYNEALLDFPCLSDDLIRQCREEVERTGESVYDTMYGATLKVKE